MISPTDSTSFLTEIRYLELGKDVSDETLTQSARGTVIQACTAPPKAINQTSWQTPSIQLPSIDSSPTSLFTLKRPPPSRRNLLRTLPTTPACNIPPLLDWGAPATDTELAGLSALDEFVSGIKFRPDVSSLSIAHHLLLKRRRPTEERSHNTGSALNSVKKPRFAIPPLTHKPLSAAVSPKVQAAALSALQSKSSTKKQGSVRLRLGLSKRTKLGSKLAHNPPIDESYDVSFQVKLTPRRELGSGPSRILDTEASDVTGSSDGALSFGVRVPDDLISASRGEKLQLDFPVELVTRGPGQSDSSPSTSVTLDTSHPGAPNGTVLVPASPSLTGSLVDTLNISDIQEDSSLSRVDTTMLSDYVPESPGVSFQDISFSGPNAPPSFRGHVVTSSPPLNRAVIRRNPPNNDSHSVTPDVLVSASLSLSFEEAAQRITSAQRNDNKEPSVRREVNQADISVGMATAISYDSSQDSNTSQNGPTIDSPSPLAQSRIAHGRYESIPWDLSQLTYNNGDPYSPRKDASASVSNNPAFDPNTNEASISDPGNQLTNSAMNMLSTLYNSSQGSSPPRPDTSRDQALSSDQTEDPVPTPVPSWDSSLDVSFRPLSGARPSGIWGSFPVGQASPEDLIAASRSLSLEDLDVRPPSASRQPANAAPGLHTSSMLMRSITPNNFSASGLVPATRMLDTSPSHASNGTAGMRSGITRLASYASTQGSFVEHPSPILSFTPMPKQKDGSDNSIESIASPHVSQMPSPKPARPFAHKLVPKFKLPAAEAQVQVRTEPEEDISFDSQTFRPEKNSTPHGAHPARTNDDVPTSSLVSFGTNGTKDDRASNLPGSDQVVVPEQRSPMGSAETGNAKSDCFPILPNPPSPANPPPLPASKIYKGHLYSVIPQPHLIPSLPCEPPSLTEGMLATLTLPRFQSWTNQDGTPAQDQAAAAAGFLSDAWGRAAWIIPVRGRAPWEGCSGAAVSLRPIKERKKLMIVWTPAALRSFWAQMTGFRDSKRVGSLSLSFEPAHGKPPGLEAPEQALKLKGSRNFEFIKLYHDARVSLHLRTILQVLEFADEDEYGVDVDGTAREEDVVDGTKRRLLGASTRLALLNDSGQIVLIS